MACITWLLCRHRSLSRKSVITEGTARSRSFLRVAFILLLALGFVGVGEANARPAGTSIEIAPDSSRSDSLRPARKLSPDGLAIASGKQFQLKGYIQFLVKSPQPEAGKNSGAELRRIRFSLGGEPAKEWQYLVQADLAVSPKVLDAYVTFSPFTFLSVAAGQFKIPLSRESLNSSGTLEFIDRARVVESLSSRSGDVIGNQNGRDVGIQLSGSALNKDGSCLLQYAVGVFDGSGINTVDNNNAKDICGRIVLHPLAGLDFGGSFYDGFDMWESPPSEHARTRFGVELGYDYQSLNLAGEYIAGKDGAINRSGWYAQASCFLVRKALQAVVRYDVYNSDESACGSTTRIYAVGANYFFVPSVKLQADYLMMQNEMTQNNRGMAEVELQCGF